jgi:molybdopterin-guanine dinucleotide biosynthesis protein A
MGRDKATLPFGPEVLLQRTVRTLGEIIAPADMVVVAADGQRLPSLASEIRIVTDRRPDRGPLEALSVGLAELGPGIEAAFVTGCDFPLLTSPFVLRLFELLGQAEIAVPNDGTRRHCLTAVYRPQVRPVIERLLSDNCLKVQELLARCDCRDVSPGELWDIDPDFHSLRNINTPEQYEAALLLANLPCAGRSDGEAGPSASALPRPPGEPGH